MGRKKSCSREGCIPVSSVSLIACDPTDVAVGPSRSARFAPLLLRDAQSSPRQRLPSLVQDPHRRCCPLQYSTRLNAAARSRSPAVDAALRQTPPQRCSFGEKHCYLADFLTKRVKNRAFL